MTRKECLDAATECVLKDRQNQYGKPEDNFGRIARLWSDYIGVKLDGIDVAMLMSLLKIARIRNNKAYEDGYIDLAGYAACGAELAGKAEAYRQFIEEVGAEYKKLRAEGEVDGEDVKSADVVVLWKHKPEAEGGCCQSGNDQQEFKPGDRVQYHVTLPSVSDGMWVDAEYDGKLTNGREHTVKTEKLGIVVVDGKDIRPAPKAEGCEELVQKDAPQTKEELFNRILSVNPATYGRARKPTGEELAEMAEEDGNACS